MTRTRYRALACALAASIATTPASANCEIPDVPSQAIYQRNYDLVYNRVGGVPQRMDFYKLKAGVGPFPLVIVIHGGGWKGGSKDHSFITDAARRWTALGYQVAAFDYPLSGEPNGRFPAAVRQLRCGMRFLTAKAALYGIDPSRVVIYGSSAGANLAAMVAYSGAAAVGLDDPGCAYASYPMIPIRAAALQSGIFDLEEPAEAARARTVEYLAGTAPGSAAAASPINYVTPQAPPTLLSHNIGDTVVMSRQSAMLSDRLAAAGVVHDLRLIPGEQHSPSPFATTGSMRTNACAIQAWIASWMR